MEFDWTANVFDFTVQASKSFLVIEPHIGIGAAFGSSATDAGLSSEVSVVDGSGKVIGAVADESGKVVDASGKEIGKVVKGTGEVIDGTGKTIGRVVTGG